VLGYINLINSHFVESCKDINDPHTQASILSLYGLLNFKIGMFYFELGTYEQAVLSFNTSLQLFNQLPDLYKFKFFNSFQEIFNCLGIIECQREAYDKCMPYLLKAEQIYQMVTETDTAKQHNTSITNDFQAFLE
jgi:tetratricopeptide (TPR) repeat protein